MNTIMDKTQTALGCVVYVFLKSKGNVLSGIILFLTVLWRRGLECLWWVNSVTFMVLDPEGTKVFLKAIVSE